MHPNLAPRGRGQSPRPLRAGCGCIWSRIPFKSLPNTGPGSHIYCPEALLTNLAFGIPDRNHVWGSFRFPLRLFVSFSSAVVAWGR